ncbi:recombinase [Pedobacter kyungheensis]|uniref:Recombinase n=1 Tax=Pedobacter kyungheensis TaxID=1069985 RepID=A0A0C1DMC7_9SPHI|nr:site-specific integrase [Pedobacter kyungheensis]KIA95165.1 recombinase [Pedobacter kyungheensis]
MKINLSLLFYLKKRKSYKNGPVDIYMRVTVNGKRSEITTGRSCEPEKWSISAGRSSGKTEDSRTLNAYLNDLKTKIYEIHRQLIQKDEEITADIIRDRFLGKEETPITLVSVFQEHNRKVEILVGSEYTSGTAERYRTSLKHTINFLEWKYKVSDISLKKINHQFISEYDFYLRSVRKCNNNSAVKYLKNFGKIIRICLANEWMSINPFLNYKHKVKPVEREYLTEKEISTIASKAMVSERLQQIRDIFLFSCFTGLAYIDVKQLKRDDIIQGIDGEKWISIKRQKTNIPSRIPLLPTAMTLIDRYGDNQVCEITGTIFPVCSNQKMNSYLKEIADICGIKKQITFHIARHTFATTVTMLNGVPIESISKMLGHTNIKTTQHYAKMLDIRVSTDMAKLKAEVNYQPINFNPKIVRPKSADHGRQ